MPVRSCWATSHSRPYASWTNCLHHAQHRRNKRLTMRQGIIPSHSRLHIRSRFTPNKTPKTLSFRGSGSASGGLKSRRFLPSWDLNCLFQNPQHEVGWFMGPGTVPVVTFIQRAIPATHAVSEVSVLHGYEDIELTGSQHQYCNMRSG